MKHRTAAPTLSPEMMESDSLGGVYIDDVYDEVAPLPPEERERILALRCAGHPTVEAEVRALLRATDGSETALAPPIRLVPGARVGRYRLEQQLGAGATASVWKAFDTHLHSFTALKLLHPDGRMRGSTALEAVLREARAASAIISDHVVRIKTAGRFEGGPHFVEMELCAEHRPGPGGSEVLEIGRTLADADLTRTEEIARVVAEAARGVDAAHRVGVLHRDLKPGNILLTPVSRRAKVTDFGLAAEQLFPPPTGDTPSTATVTVLLEAGDGRVVGTPAYMAPEQALGHPPTRAGDVYALGATLYALLARRPPYEPDGHQPIQALDVLAQVRIGPPRPIGRVARVPRRLGAIVDKAMARSPRDRYRTASDLATDLERWLRHRTTSVDGRAPLLRTRLFVRRNRSLVGTVAVLFSVLAVFALAVGWLDLRRRELETAIHLAEQHLVDAERAASEAASVRDRTLLEKEQAEEARRLAQSGQSTAEEQARKEIERRRLAEQARDAAELVRSEAEAARSAMEAERDLALSAQEQALAEAALARESELEAMARAEQESAARRSAEGEVREIQLAMNEAQIHLRTLAADAEAERLAREAAEAEVARLSLLLEAVAAPALEKAPPPVQ